MPHPENPTEPLPIARVGVGMTVADSAGDLVGTVTAVQMPGTDVRPELPADETERLMSAGYFRTDGGGPLAHDYYVDGGQIADVVTTQDSGDVTLTVPRSELPRGSRR
jgi:hypothetical protein